MPSLDWMSLHLRPPYHFRATMEPYVLVLRHDRILFWHSFQLEKLWIPYAQFSFVSSFPPCSFTDIILPRLNAILISRFLLNLRHVDSIIIGDDESIQGHLANRVVGSFGAPLEDPETEHDWSIDATDESYGPTFRSASRNSLHI